jgi:predicted transcriptional regulator
MCSLGETLDTAHDICQDFTRGVMSQPVPDIPRIQPGGLVTVAFLKARLDEGNDHLGIFMPLILDIIPHFRTGTFGSAEVQELLASTHGVAMPKETVSTLLKRLARKKYLHRDFGRYHLDSRRQLPASNVAGEKAQIESSHLRLAEALMQHATKRGLTLASPDVALDALLRFLEEEKVTLLLGDPPVMASSPEGSRHERVTIAEFVHDAIVGDQALLSVLRGVIEGLVLYHAAFLPELARVQKSFRGFRVVFDSGLVRQALGYEGLAMQTLMRETLGLLSASGVQCLVFDTTVLEIKRILAMYEERLATAEGRAKLWPVAITRHFLSEHYSPSDIRQMSALLRREIVDAGFQVMPAPPRAKEFTANEELLGKRLADPIRKDELEHRVMHDVDCVAGVLTLRRGHRAATIEESRAIFATASPMVLRNTRQWWEEDERETGIPPIVHIRALANLSWLKKPSVCVDFKVRELIALCGAAMRPTPKLWRRFLKHLESLKHSNKITSDEETLILVSAMSDALLKEAELEQEHPDDVDAVTLNEIVERVKASYGAHADEELKKLTDGFEMKISEVEAQARQSQEQASSTIRTLAERLRQRELIAGARARTWARRVTQSTKWIVALLVVMGAIALIVSHPFKKGWIGTVLGVAIIAFVIGECAGILRHVSEWSASVEVRLAKRFRDWLSGEQEGRG